MLHAELIERTTDDRIDGLLERFRSPVERRHGRLNDRSGFRKRRQVFEMNHAEGHLARHDDQGTSLLEHHVRGARKQRVRDSVGDARDGSHRTRHDRHRVPPRATAGERRSVIAKVPNRKVRADGARDVPAAFKRPDLRRRRRKADRHLDVAMRPPPLT